MPELNTNVIPNLAAAQQNALQTKRMQLENQGLEMQNALRPRQMQMDEKSLQIQELALDIRRKALEQADKPGDITLDYPGFSLAGPPDKVAKIASLAAMYPDQVDTPEFLPFLASEGVSFNVREPEQGSTTEINKLLTEMESLPEGDPRRQFYMNRLAKLSQQTGTIIRQTPDGGFEMIQGANVNAPEMQRKTAGAIEDKIISGKEQLARMQRIYNEFKPEYQEIGTRLSNAFTGAKAKLGMDIPEQDQQSLTDYKKFQRKAIENINLYIKELTGAQMSEKEADRLRLAQPDPGENWWQGDDPITFKAKMDDVMKMTRAAVARYEYYRSKGLGDQQIKSIINDNTAISLEAIAERLQ